MEKKKILTFSDLIARKLQKDKDEVKFKDIEVKSLGGFLKFEKPTEEDVLEFMDEMGDGEDKSKTVRAFEKLIYNCCSTFKEKELKEQFKSEIKIPFDIVKLLIPLQERMQIGNELLEMSGMKDEKEIKN